MPKKRLLQSAPELFTKDALLWYRMGQFSSWDDPIRKLELIGAQERVISFISIMENLFRKLSRIPDDQSRIQIIRRNLLPHIQSRLLQSVSSLSGFLQLARTIEETEWRIQQCFPPTTNVRQLLEPELANRRPTNAAVPIVDSNQHPQNKSDVLVPTAEAKTQVTFWNCNGIGHRFRKCDQDGYSVSNVVVRM
ncbi:hypothetical protein JTB14_016781 [Gonioctena quinquepunctata]|nr:hypothetical protein JTB14_016781 [Gonioctena quinquepunctata]